jgi:hypothetical protein
VPRILAHPDVVDKLLIWREQDPRMKWQNAEERAMQRQFTIELRVDYADNGKNESMRAAVAAAARHVYATAALLADATKPQIACFSDDYFTGHEEIKALEDTISDGKTEIGGGTEEVSRELLTALRDSAPAKE